MLALPLSDATLQENGVKIFSSFTLHADYKRVIDGAGIAFETFYRERILGIKPEEPASAKESAKEPEEEAKEEEFGEEDINKFEKKRHKKKEKKEGEEEETLYQVLGLESLGMGASEAQIKSAYRKLALIHHPDKQAEGTQTSPKWLKILNAYETLTDPEKKKKYDSTMPFDEDIPEGPVEESKFFEVYKPVFIRNAFWSNKKPVPDIGDMKTDLKKVERFYNFWDNFDSWRDFSVFDEYNLDEAENRYERRYMEKENKKIKGNHLRKERQRIMKLVEQARENDPRLIKARKEEEEKRAKQKLEKQMKKDQYKKDKEDREKREEEAKVNKIKEKEDEERRVAEEKKRVQDEVRKAIKDLKTAFAEKIDSAEYDRFWLESFMEKLKHADIVELGGKLMNAKKNEALKELNNYIDQFQQLHKDRTKELYKKDKEQEKQRKEEALKKKEADWSIEELSLLSKGLVKFPVGTRNRWACIASFLGTKNSEEVLQKAKELNNAQGMKGAAEKSNKEAFSQVQKAGMKDVGAEPDQRIVFDETGVKLPPQNGAEKKKPADKPKEKTAETAAKEAPKEAPKEGTEEEDVWAQDQQKQLELALREFPASMEAQERWTKIAEKVTGKTKKQCIARFKQLRDAIKKAAPGPAGK